MPKPSSLPRGVRAVRSRLADGRETTYLYHRASGRRLPPLNDPGFAAALEEADRSIGKQPATDTLRALIAAYKTSPEWASHKPRTQDKASRYLAYLAKVDHLRVADLRRREILTLRDAVATARGPAAGNAFAQIVAALLAWAVDREWLEYSPAARIRGLPGGSFPTWTEAEYAAAVTRLPEHLRRVVVLAAYTGQRRGDLCAMTWAAYDGRAIRLTQEKTGKALRVPCHPDLKAELDAWKAGATSTHILVGRTGVPWDGINLSNTMKRHLEAADLRSPTRDLNLHGLRKLAAVRLAEAGCTAKEIAAITGHDTLKEIERYTADASQERLAEAAILRLPTRLANGKSGKVSD